MILPITGDKQDASLMPQHSSSWQGLRAATIALGNRSLATLPSFPLSRRVIQSRELLLSAVAVITSRYGGLAAGLLIAVASVLIFSWFFDITPAVLDFGAWSLVRAIVLGFLAVLVAVLERQRRQALGHLAATNRELQTASRNIKTLRGLLPICSYCKQIETDVGSWLGLEEYVRRNTEAEFTHGICPHCLSKYFPEVYKRRYEQRCRSQAG
jgi:K+-sensing histidine kinase KdpD